MKILIGPHRRRSESGVALLIAIFVLLLIGVTAIALILSSGTESALAGNYRSSASTYYAALAGLEEARGRLLPSNPDYLGPVMAPLGTPLPLGSVVYILNPLPGEIVNPTDLSNTSTYPDKEYVSEFAGTPYATPTVVTPVSSVSPAAGLPGPLYKWVRINAVTEKSLNVDVDSKHTPSTLDSTTPLFYDFACTDASPGNPGPSLCLNHSANAVQALEITALASLPNGSQKLLQYVVTPSAPNLNFAGGVGSQSPSFPAALTLDGNNVIFEGPTSTSFNINGKDQFPVGACSPGATSAVYAIGYTNAGDSIPIPAANAGNYLGLGTSSPNVSNINVNNTPPLNYQTPSGLDALVQSITQGADDVIPGPATQTNLPSAMSASNPMTIVVNGNLDLTGWHNTGYGLLLVTGRLTYDPDATWNGIILVIGQGEFVSTKGGIGQINGALLVAKTRDASGKLLPDPNLGKASFVQTGGGEGIYYSSCWINAAAGAQKPLTFKVLSYRQLSQ
ncbi:MAG: hypothetical protein ACHQLQ_08340 [Candidatus Acidiferrales bacterium]